MSGRLCTGCVGCTTTGCHAIAYCVDDFQPPPCPHDTGACGNCLLDSCQACRLDAEREMAESGVYDPRKDPFYLPDAVNTPKGASTRYGGVPIRDKEQGA